MEKIAVKDYAFRFDALPQRITFTRQIKVTGWLLHRRGLTIRGIRGIVRGVLPWRSVFRARRKRSRPLVAAAYPELPDAGQSGFLLVVELPAGPSRVTIQVQDHKKIWRTIFVTRQWAFPLSFLHWVGLPRVEHFLVSYLSELFGENRRTRASSLTQASAAGSKASVHSELQTETSNPIVTEAEIKDVQLFVTSKSNLFIREIAELLCAGFRAAGCEARLLVDRIPAEKTEPGKVQIVVTPHEFFNLFLSYKLPWQKIQRVAKHLFLLSTEQPESEWFESNLVVAPHARAMLDIHLSGVIAYRARGLPCFHLPLGYDWLLEQGARWPKRERHVDICLLAAMTDRREEFIAANADFFAARNCHLRLVPIEVAKTKETRSYLTPPQRNRLLHRTKILLNVHYSALRYFEWHRALIAIANRSCLVTETCEGFEPLVAGKHFVMARADDLMACCDYYLQHPDEREAITDAAYKFVREHFTQKDNCRALLQQIIKGVTDRPTENKSSAALETGDTELIQPLPASLEKDRSRKPMGLFLSALREDLDNLFRFRHARQLSDGTIPTDPNEVAQQIAIFAERRRGYSERFDTQTKARENGEPIFEVFDNPSFDASTPAISVLVTLYNYGAYIRQCIKSLEDSHTASIPGGIEVVIVNDASTDDSLKHAMALQKNSRHPVRIIDKRLNTGLADARNIALQLARGCYVFILDADNMLFPRALEQLHAKIVEDGSVAAYSMLCRFEEAENHREGLLSYFDWDPQMLVERPYIDAMALFDRYKLIEIGGYDTDLFKFGWFGWEDYDLWLRIAQARLRVSFLPNVLCLYRHHKKAMSNTTNLFERDLVAHLSQKYRSLIMRYPPKRRILGVKKPRFEEKRRVHAVNSDDQRSSAIDGVLSR